MSISERIEKNFERNFDNSWNYERLASIEYFVRLVEDLTDSEVVSYGYYEDYEALQFNLASFEKWLSVDLYGNNLADCTKSIIFQAQDFLTENKRKSL